MNHSKSKNVIPSRMIDKCIYKKANTKITHPTNQKISEQGPNKQNTKDHNV